MTQRLSSFGVAIKRNALFLLKVVLAYLLYHALLRFTFLDRQIVYGVIALWLAVSYLVLPRVHRLLSKVYVPRYFIGRTRTGDGLLGDPVNVAVYGTKKQLVDTMHKAGWVQADELNAKSTLEMIKRTIARRSYPNAPVSSLYLFDRKQDLAFQQEVGGTTSQRHHVRFWKTPRDWWLPGGMKADWLGAATFDKGVGLSYFTYQITHRIEENIDEERDYVVDSMITAAPGIDVETVEHYASGYHDRNGGGDTIRTDGNLPFIDLRSVR